MRHSLRRLTTAVAVVLGVALSGSVAVDAQSVMKVCGEQWQAAKAAGTTSDETWQQFLAQCRAQQGGSAAQAPTPAPTMHTVPAAPAPAPANYGSAPAATSTGEFTSDQQARAHCPSDTVVWVNTRSHVYHFAGTSYHGRNYYGNTKEGAYMCEADARAAGDRAASDEHRP